MSVWHFLDGGTSQEPSTLFLSAVLLLRKASPLFLESQKWEGKKSLSVL